MKAKALCPLCRQLVPIDTTPLRTYRTLGGERRTRYVCAHHSIDGRTHDEEQGQ